MCNWRNGTRNVLAVTLHSMNTQASKQRRLRRLAVPARSNETTPQKTRTAPEAGPATLDPWLFDTEKLLGQLDRIREAALRIPLASHEVHLATQAVVDQIWRLREYLRELLNIRAAGQDAWRKRQETAAVRDPLKQARHEKKRRQFGT
jgi:hypothetical protein